MSARAIVVALAAASSLMGAGCATTGGGTEKGPSLLPFAPAEASAALAKPKRFALLVGIDAFEDERFKPLKFSASDAQAFAAALQGFDDVQLLVEPARTSRAALLEAVRALAAKARDPRDTVVLYLSSHGSLGRKPGGPLGRYLVTRDTRLDLLAETGVAVEDLLRQVERIPSRRKAVILAACHSGKGKSLLTDELEQALARQKSGALPTLEEVSEATVVLTASAFGETARESEELGRDIYTHFLLEALAQGDRDGDGAVTASEAHDWAREKTYAYTRGAQRPTSESDILGKDPIVLAGSPQRVGKPTLYSYALSAEGMSVWVDGAAKGVLPGGIAVEPGRRMLELRAAGSQETIWRGALSLAPGERAELSRLIPRRFEVGAMAEGGGLLPFSSVVRQRYWPASWEVGARILARNWPVEGLVLHGRVGHVGAQGTEQAFDTELPFRVTGTRCEVGAGYSFHLGESFSVTPGLAVGMVWLDRAIDIEGFTARQSLRGSTGAVEVDLEATIWRWIRAGLRVEAGIAKAQLGESAGPYGFGAASLQLGWVL
ncbi:MAG: caspase family protein [Deltaproteobacteria bacterium]|nr:caspase family protein [Deltaproteobacteria bacterium]